MEADEVSPWKIARLPREATADDVERALCALADEDDDPEGVTLALAAVVDRTARTIRRWKAEGCSGPSAILIHLILWLENEEIRTGGC